MIKEMLVSFSENIKTKTTNPFFGTLILVWILHNWRLIYSIFNFDYGTKLQERKDFIAQYLDPWVFLPNLILCIGVTIIVLIISYSLINLSRLIVNFFEKIITPLVYKWTDKSSIVLRKDYDLLREEKIRFENRFEQEREARLRLQNEYDALENKLKDHIDKEKKSSDPKMNESEKFDFYLSNQAILNSFKKMSEVITNKRRIHDNEDAKLMLNYNLIQKGNGNLNQEYHYDFTPEGQKLRQVLIDRELKGQKQN